MEDFLWIDFNLQKIDNHGLSADEVENAWQKRRDIARRIHAVNGPYTESQGTCPSGRVIKIIWRYNDGLNGREIFIITAY